MQYKKLVRDNIPQIIFQIGKTPVTHSAEDDEYEQKLNDKLQEEVQEFLSSSDEEELADIMEVVYAIAEFKGISKETIEEIRAKKAEERGGFKNRTILDEVK